MHNSSALAARYVCDMMIAVMIVKQVNNVRSRWSPRGTNCRIGVRERGPARASRFRSAVCSAPAAPAADDAAAAAPEVPAPTTAAPATVAAREPAATFGLPSVVQSYGPFAATPRGTSPQQQAAASPVPTNVTMAPLALGDEPSWIDSDVSPPKPPAPAAARQREDRETGGRTDRAAARSGREKHPRTLITETSAGAGSSEKSEQGTARGTFAAREGARTVTAVHAARVGRAGHAGRPHRATGAAGPGAVGTQPSDHAGNRG
jgi:hypothetical protein